MLNDELKQFVDSLPDSFEKPELTPFQNFVIYLYKIFRVCSYGLFAPFFAIISGLYHGIKSAAETFTNTDD